MSDNREMKFSYVMLPDYPLSESLDMIRTADELGFYACYSVDETWHKDLWLLFASAADKTNTIRFGPDVTHVFLREPTLICQQLATLDEVKIDFQGDFFQYTGLFTAARPVQEHLPLKMGAMKGPRSFEAAGEIADGMHHALGYAREAYDYAVEHVRIGADRAGRDPDNLDLGAWVVFVVSEDSAAAKRAARIITAFYIPSMPPELLERHGVDVSGIQPINDAFAAGDVAKAIELTTPELGEKLSMAGTPEECIEQIRTNVQAAGINHMI